MRQENTGGGTALLRGGLLGALLLSGFSWQVAAAVKPAAVFADRMVVQRDRPVNVWGTADPQEAVTVAFAGQQKTVTADAGGRWCVCLDPLSASAEPRAMTLSGTVSKKPYKVQDILVGEVWIFAGGLPVAQRLIHLHPNVDQAIAAARAEPAEPKLRVFCVKQNASREVLAGVEGSWRSAEASALHELPADGYYVGRKLVAELGVPVGIISVAMAWPGQPIETWMSRRALATNPAAKPILDYYAGDMWKMRAVGTYEERVKAWMDYCQKLPLNPPPKPQPNDKPETLVGQEPSAVWNALVEPLTRLAIRGVVWDHGEDDGGPREGVGSLQRAVQYGQLLPGLIADWRKAFGNPELPFVVVQLRPFFNSKPHGISTRLAAEMRDAQREGATAAKAAYVVSIDLPKDPHPRAVCPRIADVLLAKAYHQAGLAVDGPECVGAETVGNKVILRFRNAEGGLLAKGGGPLSGFALASSERFRWVWADAVIKGDTVEVSAPTVEKPDGVRYAYQDLPERGANLCNAAGCPAAPFRTDTQPAYTGEALNPGARRRGPARSDFIEDPRLPRVLIIGDSITSHYFYGVRDQLRSRANVLGEAGTEKGAWVDTARFYRADWASRGDDLKNFLAERGPFDIVHFNNGIHNFARAKPGDEIPYAAQLRKIVATIRASGAVCLFANSTGTLGDNTIPSSPNYLTNCKAFNAAAEKVMAECNVPVTDIFGATQPRIEELISQDLVHFKGEASPIMVAAVVARLNQALDTLPARPLAVTHDTPRPLAKPTAAQVAWQDMELEMFIHFGPATWENVQHSNLTAPLSALNPKELDTDQWADVAVSMGAKQIVFVAKHDGGFCWWQTDTTAYSVKNTPWRDGKGDVMKDLAASCRKRGLRLGVYLSPADKKQGIGVGGRAKSPAEQENYNRIYRQQLTELLSRYGEISEVWFDGSNTVPVEDILRRYAPHAMVFQGPQATITWIGNEEGVARYPTWNAMPAEKARSGVSTGYDSDPDGEVWLPSECDARIRADWFWSTNNASTLKTVGQLMGMYYGSVGHGAVLLLNHTPDTTGRIPEADARRAAEFGAEIQRRFGKSLAEASGRGCVVEVDLGKPTRLDHAITAEEIAEGERVREYVIEGLVNGEWRPLCEGTAIGHKKIDWFAPIEASKLRLRITRSAAEPRIRRLAAYSVWGDSPPAAEAREIAAAPRTVWHWSGDTVAPQGTTVNVDLTTFCKDAGVYVLEFVRTAGKELDVQSVDLVSRGQKIDKVVVRRLVRGVPQYHITITEEGSAYQLQVTARLPDAAGRGQATLCRRVR